jgi:hypothetical protein
MQINGSNWSMLLHSNCHKIIATSPEQWQRDGEEIAHSAVGEVERIGAVFNTGVAWTSPSNRRRQQRDRRSSSRNTVPRQNGKRHVRGAESTTGGSSNTRGTTSPTAPDHASTSAFRALHKHRRRIVRSRPKQRRTPASLGSQGRGQARWTEQIDRGGRVDQRSPVRLWPTAVASVAGAERRRRSMTKAASGTSRGAQGEGDGSGRSSPRSDRAGGEFDPSPTRSIRLAYWAKWARSSPGLVNWPNSFFCTKYKLILGKTQKIKQTWTYHIFLILSQKNAYNISNWSQN